MWTCLSNHVDMLLYNSSHFFSQMVGGIDMVWGSCTGIWARPIPIMIVMHCELH